MISEIELIKILNDKQKTNPKMMMDNYRKFIYTLLFSKISNMYPREYIEKYLNDIFHEILNYKDKINSQNGFIKVLLQV